MVVREGCKRFDPRAPRAQKIHFISSWSSKVHAEGQPAIFPSHGCGLHPKTDVTDPAGLARAGVLPLVPIVAGAAGLSIGEKVDGGVYGSGGEVWPSK